MPAIRFRSWLPTVTGRLSFSSFGHSLHPSPTEYTNRAAADERCLVCSQGRIGIDATIPLSLAQAIWDRDGDLVYVALCKAVAIGQRRQEALTGHVFIVQRKVAWQEAEQIVEALRRLLASYVDPERSGQLSTFIENEWDNCIRELKRRCAFEVEVEICRSGKTTITVDEESLTNPNRPSLGNTRQLQERFAHRLAAQVFYFLRDIGHHHQHHDPTTDTIVDLFRFDGSDDFSWREQVLYNIYRTIIQYKRNPQNKQFHECLGLLAYASTFQEVSKQELDPTTAQQLPYFHAIGLERSLSSMQAVSQLANERAVRRNAILQNIILWVVGFVISVIGLLQVTETKIEEPSAMLRLFGRFAVQSTEYLAGMVGFAILATVMLHSETRFNPKKWRVVINLVRTVSAWPKSLSGGFFVLIGFLVLALLYWVVQAV